MPSPPSPARPPREPLARRVVRGAFALIFALGGVNHFAQPGFYLRIMPPFLPAHGALVALSGATEVASALLLLAPRTRRLGALAVLLHLVVFLLVHGYMVARPERWPEVPVAALWGRLVVQFVAIALAAWIARPPATATTTAVNAPDADGPARRAG